MLKLVLIIIALVVGFLAGFMVRGPRRIPQPVTTPPVEPRQPPPQAQADDIPKPQWEPEPGIVEDPIDSPATDVDVARELLEVADHLGNRELVRRLVEAVTLLPGIRAVRPKPGDGFEPKLHEWAGNRITDQPARWNTIAETIAPGAVTEQHRLLRPAHVVVFEAPE